MKRFTSFFIVVSLFASIAAFAQDEQAPADSKVLEDETQSVATEEETEKAPRVYPIAAGVWYPGDPMPGKAFRYYRIRCWPGCHHNSQYGLYPDKKSDYSLK